MHIIDDQTICSHPRVFQYINTQVVVPTVSKQSYFGIFNKVRPAIVLTRKYIKPGIAKKRIYNIKNYHRMKFQRFFCSDDAIMRWNNYIRRTQRTVTDGCEEVQAYEIIKAPMIQKRNDKKYYRNHCCSVCERWFKNHNQFLKHFASHFSSDCLMLYSDEQAKKEKIVYRLINNRWKCFCGKEFNSYEDVTTHYIFHDNKNKIFLCLNCNYNTTSYKRMMRHRKATLNTHGYSIKRIYPSMQMLCKMCNGLFYDIKKHYEAYHSELFDEIIQEVKKWLMKDELCTVCDEKFDMHFLEHDVVYQWHHCRTCLFCSPDIQRFNSHNH